jgi:membrane protein
VAFALARRTVSDAHTDRIVGVAAEVAFFALLAIPPMLLVLAGAAGYVGDLLGPDVRDSLRDWLIRSLGGFLAPETMDEFVRPAVEDMFARGRAGIISLGALLAIWSASRLMRVLIEAMNIAYGVEEWRPPWRRRLLALGLTAGGILFLSSFLPFLVAGPRLGQAIDEGFGLGGILGPLWRVLYWPVTISLAVSMLTTLYHIAPNWRTPWRRDLPGAILAGASWVTAAFGLRAYVDLAISETTLGPLAAPVVMLLWLYVTALSVLLGAELNAEIDKVWPTREAGPKQPSAGLSVPT